MKPAPTVQVEVVYCPAPGQVDQVRLALPAGATVADALAASGMAQRHGLPGVPDAGIHGRAQPPHTVLREGDRVELYRPLTVDPKEARRLRYRRDRAGRGAVPPAAD
jgi:putative ubiquitin-RnfH superfamily antitoxin RatB of RatAB toxin-antitoxin module